MTDSPYCVGQVVYSKSGRDKTLPFIIVDVSGEYVFLVDGKLRPLSKPKKKKVKHIQITNNVVLELKQKLESNSYINDKDFRNALAEYKQP